MADPTVKAIQERLAAKGLYRGKIDGIMGQGTAQALAIESSMTPPKTGPSDNEVKLKELELQAESQKNDPTGRITRMLTDVAPLLGGAALGTAIGTSRANKFKAAVREVKRDAPNLQRTAEAMARSRSASSAHVQAALGDAAKSMRNVRSGGVGGALWAALPWAAEGAYARYRGATTEDPEAAQAWDAAGNFGASAGLAQIGKELGSRHFVAPPSPTAIAVAEGLGNAGKAALQAQSASMPPPGMNWRGAAGKAGALGAGFGAGMFLGSPLAKAAGADDDTADVVGTGAGAAGAAAMASPAVREKMGRVFSPVAMALIAKEAMARGGNLAGVDPETNDAVTTGGAAGLGAATVASPVLRQAATKVLGPVGLALLAYEALKPSPAY